ncbi:Tetratricopeptide repeat-containing protein [Bradyrhizobium brasilense]|uniref:Tetratricopeptide repeat-containing protein n=1 Tax=Bradyrhizobium brasilense TaxID=1419277 RepID=A0A1G7F3K0_9BRAD|nr:tetratricopeptide repeat protein [Bradyrhizobium brasilense]SDE70518.1 Tetratricopeptide repeat-containing protein [Bradyrhizobium brasilense]
MKSYEIDILRCRRSFRPRASSAFLPVLAVLLLAGCANLDHPGLSSQQTPTAELVGVAEINPAMRERIAHALVRDAGEQHLCDALKQRPDNADAAIPLARELLARKCPSEAIEVLDTVLLASPGDLRALNAKAVVLDHQSRHQEARALYRQALAADPANPMLRNNLALSLALDGKTEPESVSPQSQTDGRQALARSR